MPDAPRRPARTDRPVALFVFSNLLEQKGGLTVAWLRRLAVFAAAGWDTHVATINRQPDIDQTVAAWRARGVLPASTEVHHYQRRDRRLRTRWSRPDDETFSRDDRVADWLDWLVGRIPGVVVLADSPVTYAPVALMRNPFVGRVMTVHLSHRFTGLRSVSRLPVPESRYSGIPGRPKLQDRLLPFASAADVLVAPTHRQAEHLRADLPGSDVRTIPNIVDPDALGTTLPGELPPQPDPRLVVSVGRLESLKRLDHALRAFARVVAEVPGARLEVHGLGPDLERLEALRSKLGLDDVVSFPGFTDRPGRVLAGAALSVLTSAREAFGLSVAESLAVGTPVVCYDIDYGPGELVDDGVNGRLVADGSVEALAATIVELLTDPATMERMRAAAPASVAGLHPSVVGRLWLDLAAEVASRVQLPAGGLLVEGVRLRRRGLVLTGIVVGSDPGAAPVGVSIGGPAVGAAGPEMASTVAVAASADGDVRVVLPWPQVGRWPVGDPLRAWAADGREVPVLAPGVPPTAVPTAQGPRVIGTSPRGALVALDPVAELGIDARLLVRAEPNRAHVLVGGDVTVVTEVLRAEGTLRPGGGRSARVEVSSDLPGVGLEDGATLGLAAKVADELVLVGAVGPMSGSWEQPGGGPARWTGDGEVAWDADALVALAGREGGPEGARPLSLAIGRTPREIGALTAVPGCTVTPVVDGPWLAVEGARGRALLLRSDRGGLRAAASLARRRLRGARWQIGDLLGRSVRGRGQR